MVSTSLLLSYRGLPKSWEDSCVDDLPSATEIKLRKAIKTIISHSRGGIVYIQGNPASFFNMLYEECEFEDFVGLSFPNYFSSKMDKDLTTLNLKPRQYTFVYNVGDESALNKNFSAQLLKQLITECRDDEVWCFVCGSMSKTKFIQEYGLEIKNSLTLPTKTEITLL